MISTKELQYVNSRSADQTPYPGDEYAYVVLEELKKALELFQRQYLDRSHNLIFSNGEEIEFKIMAKNLPHMLGIDTKSLNDADMQETKQDVLGFPNGQYTNSYDILLRIVERIEEIIKNDRNPDKKRILNYYKVMIKCAVFSRISDFTKFNFGCINFNRDTFLQNTTRPFNPRSSKFLFTNSDEPIVPYFMMGILFDTNERTYIPETLFAPPDFTTFFVDQELLIPTQILTDNHQVLTRIQATSQDRISILNLYKFIINSFKTNSTINIFGDYETILRERMFSEQASKTK